MRAVRLLAPGTLRPPLPVGVRQSRTARQSPLECADACAVYLLLQMPRYMLHRYEAAAAQCPVALLGGPAGCGKSLLMKLVAAIYGGLPLTCECTPAGLMNLGGAVSCVPVLYDDGQGSMAGPVLRTFIHTVTDNADKTLVTARHNPRFTGVLMMAHNEVRGRVAVRVLCGVGMLPVASGCCGGTLTPNCEL
jgi:hypothetical protein